MTTRPIVDSYSGDMNTPYDTDWLPGLAEETNCKATDVTNERAVVNDCSHTPGDPMHCPFTVEVACSCECTERKNAISTCGNYDGDREDLDVL